MNTGRLTRLLKEEALRLGFDLVGACPAIEPPDRARLAAWVASGRAAGMGYFADRAAAYAHPRGVLPGVRSLLMLGVNYRTVEPAPAQPGHGRVARYAWGEDYHRLIRGRLAALADLHRRLVPEGQVRGVVDTAPLSEKGFAQLAGLGRIGRNTLLINPRLGSWLFLAALLSSEALDYDRPEEGSPCGACRACIKACPTGALQEDGQLDARRCLSYLTIESRTPIPEEFRAKLGDRLFGCDRCQEVCPHNRRTPTTSEPSLQPNDGMNPVDAAALLSLDKAAYRARFGRSPLFRTRRGGLLRNAAYLLASHPGPESASALTAGLSDPDPSVRDACAWALKQSGGDVVRSE